PGTNERSHRHRTSCAAKIADIIPDAGTSTRVRVSSLGAPLPELVRRHCYPLVRGVLMKRFEWYGLGLGLLLVWILGGSRDVCQEASLRYGLGLATCPDGK